MNTMRTVLLVTACLVLAGCPAKPSGRTAPQRLQDVAVLSDQAELARIAQSDPDRDVRDAAWARVTDQAVLADLALAATRTVPPLSGDTGRNAVARLTDQAQLARVAAGTRDGATRAAAVARITDQGLLAGLLVNDAGPPDRADLIPRITEPALLARLAREAKDVRVRADVTARLDDQPLLARIAATDPHGDVREAALRRLTDDTLLRGIISGSTIPEARGAACTALGERMLAAGAGEAHGVDWDNVRGITDERRLARCALSDANPDLREAAVRRIKQLPLLAHLADQGDAGIALTALEAIDDPDLLAFRSQQGHSLATEGARIKLMLRDPRVTARHPGIRASLRSSPTSQTYERGASGGIRVVMNGRTLRVELWDGTALLTQHEWQPEFPDQILTSNTGLPAGATDSFNAIVRPEELTGLLLARAEFTQADLTRIFGESPHEALLLGALENLTDEAVLARMAAKGNPDRFRRAALHNLHDQELLAAIAGDEKESDDLRRAAVENLTDQPVLARIASRFGSDELRSEALSGLTDPALLRQVAKDAAGTMIMADKIEDLVQLRLEDLEKAPPKPAK